jgi:hypothetical protein
MRRTRTLPWMILGFAIFAVLGVVPCRGQIPVPYLGMSLRPYASSNTCTNAPPPCEGAAWSEEPGRYEFDVYRVPMGSYEIPSDRVRFCLQWPSAWSVVSTEVCEGSLESGDPGTPGSALEFSLPECFAAEGPFLRIVMDCPIPGSFWAACSPALHMCDSSEWVEEYYALKCDVGDWCGRFPFHPCSFCSMGYRHAAGFDPPTLEKILPPGGTWSGGLFVWGDLGPFCGGVPECGEEYGRCFNGLITDVPWLTATIHWPPGDGFQRIPYSLEIDAAGLPPGDYAGNVVSVPGCGWCIDNCMTVNLRVLWLADVDASTRTDTVRLDGPYPNPSMERFGYAITLPAPTRARLDLLDVAGRRAATLLDRDLPAGTHDFTWAGSEAAIQSGAYVMRLDAGGVRRSRLIVIAR